MSKAIIILPTYNESGNIGRLILQLFKAQQKIPKHSFEILVVDDNSPDGTGKVVQEIQKANPRVHLLKGKKEGLGKAYIRGFQHVFKHYDPDVIVMMDADFSHNPSALPAMLAAIDNGADFVIGSRYTRGGAIPGNWPLLRIINSRIAHFVACKLGGIRADIEDVSGGFRAIRASALKEIDLDLIKTNGYAFLLRLLHEFIDRGFVITEVPITFSEREHGNSKLRLYDIFEFLKCAYGLNPHSPFKQLLRFAGVGVSGIIVNLGILYLLQTYTGTNTIISSAIAIEVSIISNFLFHTLFTFKPVQAIVVSIKEGSRIKAPGSWLRQLAVFNLATLGVAGLTITIFTLLNKGLYLHYLIAQTVAIGASFFVNFWISKKYVWRHNVTT